MVFGTTLVFGQFHELRQFDALIPVVVALILSYLVRGAHMERPAQGPSLVLDGAQVLVAVAISSFFYLIVS